MTASLTFKTPFPPLGSLPPSTPYYPPSIDIPEPVVREMMDPRRYPKVRVLLLFFILFPPLTRLPELDCSSSLDALPAITRASLCTRFLASFISGTLTHFAVEHLRLGLPSIRKQARAGSHHQHRGTAFSPPPKKLPLMTHVLDDAPPDRANPMALAHPQNCIIPS